LDAALNEQNSTMKKRLLTIAMTLALTWSFGQTKNLGNPLSWSGKLPKDIEVIEAPTFDVAEQLEIDAINTATAKHLGNRFGYEHEMDLGINSDGSWFTTPKGDHVWRLGLSATGAYSINLIFDKFYLPEGSKLHFYAADKSQLIGAYTADNNNAQNMLGTELVNSDKAVLELFVPKGKKADAKLHIQTLVHGYKQLRPFALALEKALNSSGDCNVDVDCIAGDGTAQENQRNCVAMIVSGGGICTGSLVNNTANDGTPYFITANHCGPNSAGSWVYRFRWESPNPSCATTTNSTNGPENMNINGGTLRASNSNADFGLIELNSAPNPAWNIYYNGWDMSDLESNVQNQFGIHHPSGDIKKICIDNQASLHHSMNFNGNANTQMWRILDWDQGVTEPGSSGSPLFRQDGKTIGVLSGGYAACSGTNDNGTEDWYGRFGVAWDALPGSSDQLKFWLDPSNTGQTEIDGYDPNGGGSPVALDAGITSVTSPTGTICAASISPVVVLRNFGTTTLTSTTITYSVDGGTNQVFNWTGSLTQGGTENVTLPTSAIAGGAHNIVVLTSVPNGGADENATNDDASAPFTAVVGGEQVNLALQLDCFGSETTWEIKDASNNVLYSGGPYNDEPTNQSLIEESFCLDPSNCYDFVIMDEYGDGLAVSSFCDDGGSYTITDGSSNVLASMLAADGDFGDEEINNFCFTNSINENALDNALTVYPNPANEFFTIETAIVGNYSVVLLDQSGRMIQQFNSNGYAKTQVNVTEFASGVYFVKVQADQGIVTKKIIVD
jgi:hypothetical protein